MKYKRLTVGGQEINRTEVVRFSSKRMEAKLERTHFYKAQSGKITMKKLPVFPDPVSAAMSTSPPPRIRGIASD